MPQRLQQLLEGCIVRIAPAVIVGAAWRCYPFASVRLPEHCVRKRAAFLPMQRAATPRWMLALVCCYTRIRQRPMGCRSIFVGKAYLHQ